MRTSYGIKQTC